MTDESKLILITEFIEQKLRKEQELEFYLKELTELNRKIGFLRAEVDLTNTIINMIKSEQVYDIKDNMIANNENKLIGKKSSDN
jgi:murein tripeptide amidase MpaA